MAHKKTNFLIYIFKDKLQEKVLHKLNLVKWFVVDVMSHLFHYFKFGVMWVNCLKYCFSTCQDLVQCFDF